LKKHREAIQRQLLKKSSEIFAKGTMEEEHMEFVERYFVVKITLKRFQADVQGRHYIAEYRCNHKIVIITNRIDATVMMRKLAMC